MSIETPIFEEASYDITYDVREHSNSTNVNVLCLSEEDMPLVEQGKESKDAIQKKDDVTLPDHTGIPMEEIPYVGLKFDSLHREGYRESRVKAAMRVKRITTAECKARMYVILDRQNDNWLVTKLELKHTHTCSAEQAVHYSEYRELTLHAKCVIQNNNEAGIRPNKTYLALANESKKNWRMMLQTLKELFHVHRALHLKDNFSVSTTSKFREVQHEFSKRGDCLVQGVTQEGDLFRVTVNEQYLLYGEPRSWKYSVEFDPKTHKNVHQKHTFIKSSHDEKRSDESRNLFRRLCSHFYNVAQDFVTCEEEAAMLHSGLDQLRSKFLDYRANLVSRCVPSTQNSTVTQCHPHLGESDIQGPSKEVDQALNQDVVMDFARRANESQEHGGFLSLLNSFWPA
ncbi:hypothetical protein Ahy_A10g050482 [Arachis hypogaea]|uniref:Protein FAR1-RELATED SEQUENCE n=1 Tax=Arachis hypogaea TaxID=3818 RepID=A0A445B9I2_ARAHY|nr:hypothetical protein Ahy_A10g050482 [Arachis hypogaea]